jgi:thiamine-phosphate pyrophosphorylase
MTDNTDPLCRLYLISPPDIGGDATAAFADQVAAALDGGDVACLQLRLKDVADDVIRRATDILRPVVQDRDVAFIMNDRPDLAVETGSDGVHVGQDDSEYEDARETVGDDAIVGVTCHTSIDLAMTAADQGADYVAFGAFYESNTKQRKFAAEPAILRQWQDMTVVPCVAIGGISVDNCRPIVEAGADFIAVAGGVWSHPDGPAAAVKAFNKIFEEVGNG